MARTLRLFLAPVVLLAGLCPAPAAAQDNPFDLPPYDDLRFRRMRAAGEPSGDLRDCRSPSMAHEHFVELGTPFELFGHRLVFSFDARRGASVEHTEPGEDRSRTGRLGRGATFFPLDREDADSDYAISIRLAPDNSGVLVSSAWGVEIGVGRAKAYLVDSDLDGQVPTRGDGVVVPGARTVAPWCGEVWSADSALAVRYDRAGRTWEYAEVPMPNDRDRDHSRAWRRLNWRRQQTGMLPLRYDAELEGAILAHCEYALRNNAENRMEAPGRPGYTEAGARAATESVFLYDLRSMDEGIDEFMQLLVQRGELLNGALRSTAIVRHNRVMGISTGVHLDGPLANVPVVFPSHGMTEVPRTFLRYGEDPMPADSPRENALGMPVAVWSAVLAEADRLRTAPVLEVIEIDQRGDEVDVDGTLHHAGATPPGMPANYEGNVAFVPDSGLDGGALHRCRAVIVFPTPESAGAQPGGRFEYDWEFTTD